jgi:hypothetical protein
LRQPFLHDEFALRIDDGHAQKAQGAGQGASQAAGVQHAVADQCEGSRQHGAAAEAEKFVAHPVGDGEPERAIGLGRNRRLDPRRQSDRYQQIIVGKVFVT